MISWTNARRSLAWSFAKCTVSCSGTTCKVALAVKITTRAEGVRRTRCNLPVGNVCIGSLAAAHERKVARVTHHSIHHVLDNDKEKKDQIASPPPHYFSNVAKCKKKGMKVKKRKEIIGT